MSPPRGEGGEPLAPERAELLATLEVSQDGEVIEKRPLSLARGEVQRMVFRIGGERPCSLAVELVPDPSRASGSFSTSNDGFDSLASDNVAYLDLPEARPLRVYVPPSMAAYRHALRAIRGVHLFPEADEDVSGGHFDLVVTDRPGDRCLSAETFFHVGTAPADTEKLLSIREGGTRVVDWRRDSPLLAHVELADLVILQCPTWARGMGSSGAENLGYEVLVHGHRGPLLLERREGSRIEFRLLFHTDRSTLPYRVGFPVLMANLARVAMHQAGLAEARPARTGVLPAMTLEPECAYRVSGPAGSRDDPSRASGSFNTSNDRSDARGVLSGVPAPRVGVYEITGGGRTRRVGASLLSSSETSLAGADELQFSEVSVRAATAALETDRPLWFLVSLAAFALLLLEWWYFNRAPAPLRRRQERQGRQERRTEQG